MKTYFVPAMMLLSASLAQAQAPFQQLQTRLRIGDRIQVIDNKGMKSEGRFDGVSGSSLRLAARGGRQEFLESQVREVRKRRAESRWNGALIGLGIGAGAGAVTVVQCRGASERDDCVSITTKLIAPLFALGGAGAGALIDFAIKKHDTVFSSAGASGFRFRLTPEIDGKQMGAVFSVSF